MNAPAVPERRELPDLVGQDRLLSPWESIVTAAPAAAVALALVGVTRATLLLAGIAVVAHAAINEIQVHRLWKLAGDPPALQAAVIRESRAASRFVFLAIAAISWYGWYSGWQAAADASPTGGALAGGAIGRAGVTGLLAVISVFLLVVAAGTITAAARCVPPRPATVLRMTVLGCLLAAAAFAPWDRLAGVLVRHCTAPAAAGLSEKVPS